MLATERWPQECWRPERWPQDRRAGTTGYRGGRPARLVARALAAARAWAAAGLMVAAITLALPSTTDASPGRGTDGADIAYRPRHAPRPSCPGGDPRLSSPYKVTVPPGTWVPVTVSVANRGTQRCTGADRRPSPGRPGRALNARLPIERAVHLHLPGRRGLFVQPGAGAPPALKTTSTINYTVPLDLARRHNKADSALPPDRTAGSGRVGPCRGNHRAGAGPGQRPVAGGLRTGSTGGPGRDRQPAERLGTEQVGDPDRCPAPAAVHQPRPPCRPWPRRSGPSSAVTIDQADISGVSPAQIQALEGYVETGGTLVVAGGLDWQATTAGLPRRPAPRARPTGGVSSWSLPGLSHLLGTSAGAGSGGRGRLGGDGGAAARPLPRARHALVVEATRGSGSRRSLCLRPGGRALVHLARCPNSAEPPVRSRLRPGLLRQPLALRRSGRRVPRASLERSRHPSWPSWAATSIPGRLS